MNNMSTRSHASYLVHMCCRTARLSCHAPIFAYECSSVLKEISVGLQGYNTHSRTLNMRMAFTG